jgi:hypothetical protein
VEFTFVPAQGATYPQLFCLPSKSCEKLRGSSKTLFLEWFARLFYNGGMTKTLAPIVRIIPFSSRHQFLTPTLLAANQYVSPRGRRKTMGGVAHGIA